MKEFLISYGYGAGWNSWASDENKEFMLFNKGLIKLAKRNAEEEEVMEYLKSKGIDEYVGGWENIRVCKLKDNEMFIVEEYDGNESIKLKSETKWFGRCRR